MKLLDGTPEEIAKFLDLTEGSVKIADPVDIYRTPKTVLDYMEAAIGPRLPLSQKDETRLPSEGRSSSLGNSVQPMTILPTRSPPKERTAKLEAYFRDYIRAGLTAKAIQEHLIKEHDISMNGHQICGWLGRMKQQEKRMWAKCGDALPAPDLVPSTEPRGLLSEGHENPRDDSKPDKETSSQAPNEDAAKEPTTSPRSKELNLPQIKEIKRLYNKDHLRTIHIAKRMGISQEQVEAIVWQVKA
ncbi:hypothetical protein M0R72_14885 [Candidatus Pacearchaeota archaeon]|nr:hypothetical protein [Candidatus Pacearchaeota archaeon]